MDRSRESRRRLVRRAQGSRARTRCGSTARSCARSRSRPRTGTTGRARARTTRPGLHRTSPCDGRLAPRASAAAHSRKKRSRESVGRLRDALVSLDAPPLSSSPEGSVVSVALFARVLWSLQRPFLSKIVRLQVSTLALGDSELGPAPQPCELRARPAPFLQECQRLFFLNDFCFRSARRRRRSRARDPRSTLPRKTHTGRRRRRRRRRLHYRPRLDATCAGELGRVSAALAAPDVQRQGSRCAILVGFGEWERQCRGFGRSRVFCWRAYVDRARVYV